MVKLHVVVLFAKTYLAIIKGTYVTETNKTFTEYLFQSLHPILFISEHALKAISKTRIKTSRLQKGPRPMNDRKSKPLIIDALILHKQ